MEIVKLLNVVHTIMIIAATYSLIQALSYILGESINSCLSKKKNYRIVTNGEGFGVEERFLPSWIPFKIVWQKYKGSYYHETEADAEVYINKQVEYYLNRIASNSTGSEITKRFN